MGDMSVNNVIMKESVVMRIGCDPISADIIGMYVHFYSISDNFNEGKLLCDSVYL